MTIDEAIDELSGFLYSDCYLYAPSDEAIKVALSALHEKNCGPSSPCDLCAYNPPSSLDGKPCTMCPATGQ